METHLDHEEALMRGYNYPDIVAHQQIHDRMRSRVGSFEASLACGKANVATELMTLLNGLLRHIGEEDTRAADHMREPQTLWVPVNGVQPRKYLRLPISFPLTYVLDGDPVVKHGRALDIGGGGTHFESDEDKRVAEDTSMTIRFELPEAKVEVRGRPVVSYYANGRHRHRIAFSGVPDEVRDIILTFVFKTLRTEVLNR